ncbi:MAG: hypothetical protein HY303_13210 [Candidatus Wallbacteria bacterium]|nr:hypothetical protein [Candidatus Wallbacteria bacterium]
MNAQPQPPRSRWFADVIAGALLAALPLGLYFVPLAAGTLPDIGGDNLFGFFPMLRQVALAFSRGELPHWSPEVGIGYPVLASLQPGTLSPQNALLLRWFPFDTAMTLMHVVHIGVALLGMYALLRHFGCGPFGASVAALAYTFGSTRAGGFIGLSALRPGAWLPVAWVLQARFVELGGPWNLLLAVAATALMILGGHPQITFMGILAMLLGTTAALAASSRSRAAAGFGATLLIGLLAIGLSGAQLLPTREMAQLSIRAAGDKYELLVQQSFLPPALLSLLVPPLADLPIQLPGFDSFRHPIRFLFLSAIGISLLAAVGTDALLGWRRSGQTPPGARKVLCSLAAATTLFVGGSAVTLDLAGARIETFGKAAAHRLFLSQRFKRNPPEHYDAKVEQMARTLRQTFDPSLWTTWQPPALAALVAVVAHALRGPAGALVTGGLIVSATVSELLPQQVRTVPEYLAQPGISRYLQARQRGRVYFHLGPDFSTYPGGYYLGGVENANLLHGIQSVGVFDSLAPYPYFAFLDDLAAVDVAIGRKSVPLDVLERELPKLRALSCRYVLSTRRDLERLGLVRLAALQDGCVYEIRNTCPRARAVYSWRVAAPDMASKPTLTPCGEVLVDSPPPAGLRQQPGLPCTPVALVEESSTRVRLRVDMASGGLLVLADLAYPGWTADVDGHPSAPVVCDCVLRGVWLGRGAHDVTFRFDPASVRQGLAVTEVSGVLLALVCLGAYRRRRSAARE